jgi:mRNA interferase RelE/StbE
MRYRIEYRKSVDKEIRKLPEGVRRTIVTAILILGEDPYPNGVTKLRGSERTYRIRQGDYRIIYEIHDTHLVVEVVKVGHRRDVYRKF